MWSTSPSTVKGDDTGSPSVVEGYGYRRRSVCSGIGQPDPESCPISCMISKPVCGDDGYTYYCGCRDAMCSGARVIHAGECSK
ncbi:hypothetical protein LINPERPRIM_LOCUS27755 [Linum perenne]